VASVGGAHAPSPDARSGPPVLRSLGCRRRSAILASLVCIRRLPGHGHRSRDSLIEPGSRHGMA
jgi:hypothetical protein